MQDNSTANVRIGRLAHVQLSIHASMQQGNDGSMQIVKQTRNPQPQQHKREKPKYAETNTVVALQKE